MSTKPPALRVLPMNPEKDPEFREQGIQTCADVQQSYFLKQLPFEQQGRYYYSGKKLNAEVGAVVLFQCKASIIASAEYLGDGPSDKPEYEGYMRFAPKTIRVFDPVKDDVMREVFPKFKRFSQSYLKLDADRYFLFEERLTNVRTP
jgi:hypothetical protein